MHRTVRRSLVLASALVALSLPVFGATHSASACSLAPGVVSPPSCYATTTIPTNFETFISGIGVVPGTSEFAQVPTTAELPDWTVVTIPGTLSFVVNDFRGNNQGWTAAVTCAAACLTTSLAPGLPIPNTAITVASPVTVTAMPIIGQAFDAGMPNPAAYGADLSTSPIVASAPGCQGIGKASYAVTVPLHMTLTGPTLEVLNFPISWTGTFVVTVSELPSPEAPVTTPCPIVLT